MNIPSFTICIVIIMVNSFFTICYFNDYYFVLWMLSNRKIKWFGVIVSNIICYNNIMTNWSPFNSYIRWYYLYSTKYHKCPTDGKWFKFQSRISVISKKFLSQPQRNSRWSLVLHLQSEQSNRIVCCAFM